MHAGVVKDGDREACHRACCRGSLQLSGQDEGEGITDVLSWIGDRWQEGRLGIAGRGELRNGPGHGRRSSHRFRASACPQRRRECAPRTISKTCSMSISGFTKGPLHCHFSCIEFTEAGERRHLPLDRKTAGLRPLRRLHKGGKLEVTIISETPEPEEGAKRDDEDLANVKPVRAPFSAMNILTTIILCEHLGSVSSIGGSNDRRKNVRFIRQRCRGFRVRLPRMRRSYQGRGLQMPQVRSGIRHRGSGGGPNAQLVERWSPRTLRRARAAEPSSSPKTLRPKRHCNQLRPHPCLHRPIPAALKEKMDKEEMRKRFPELVAEVKPLLALGERIRHERVRGQAADRQGGPSGEGQRCRHCGQLCQGVQDEHHSGAKWALDHDVEYLEKLASVANQLTPAPRPCWIVSKLINERPGARRYGGRFQGIGQCQEAG